MPTEFVTADRTGSGPQVTLSTFDADVIIAQGVLVATSSFDAAVLGSSSYHDVVVYGGVASEEYGIALGVLGESTDNFAFIAPGASVYGENGGVVAYSADSRITNDGSIYAGITAAGVTLGGIGEGRSHLVNRGVISGDYGVQVNLPTEEQSLVTTETVVVTNYGNIVGTFAGYAGGANVDQFINRGTVKGNIGLQGGDDVYDGRQGSVDGAVYGYLGNDTFLAGGEADTFYGEEGFDTLDFRGSTGLRVSMADGSGTEAASGDRYFGIERVLGSASGADQLIGNAAANVLQGLGGKDVLVGNGGADVLRGDAGTDSLRGGTGGDTLAGGAGRDDVRGGLGNDTFQYGSRAAGGDVIADFHNAAGDNDRFRIDASVFGGGLVAGGLLPASQFRMRADNLAQDADDRFVFRTTDATLWFDSNGSAAGGLTLVADLQAGATVTSADILLY
jgi:Ca2+-binding RTX toxin-like protein